MKVLIVGSYAMQTPHFETELELIERHRTQGDAVTYLICNARLPSCDPNVYHAAHQCLDCVSSRHTGLALVDKGVDVRPFYTLTSAQKRELAALKTSFATLEDLKAYTIESFD